MSFYEVTRALEFVKTRIDELEANMSTIKDTLTNQFRKEIVEVERVHTKEMLRKIQFQEKELKVEFDKKVTLDRKAHQAKVNQFKSTHSQEIMMLKYEQLEIINYNENIEE
jgi:hypothetical protein